MSPEIRFIRVTENAILPTRGSLDAAGFDVYASDYATIMPGTHALVPTGLKVALHKGYELQVRPRSGLALKYGITVLNSPGTIDADYRGLLGVILMNHGTVPFSVSPGDRIAQVVLTPVLMDVTIREVTRFDDTERGENGFGSTGV